MRTLNGYLFKRKRIDGKVRYLPVTADVDAFISFNYQAFGVRKTISTGTTDPEQAAIYRDKYLANVRSNSELGHLRSIIEQGEWAKRKLYGAMSERNAIQIKDVWKRFLASRRRPASGPVTLKGYQQQWDRFARGLPKSVKTLEQVTPDMCEAHIVDLEAGDSARKIKPCGRSTCNAHSVFLRLLFRVLLPGCPNPWEGVRSTAPTQQTPYRRLSVSECKAILKASSGEWATLMLIGYTTGARLVDAVHVRWDQIDSKRQVIRFTPQKTARRTGTKVEAPLLPQLAAKLRSMNRTDAHVLPGLVATYKADRSMISKMISRIFKKAKVGDTEAGMASFHSFRVTWQSLNDEAGTPRVFARAVLGHKSSRMSDTYSRVDVEKTRSAVRAAIPRIT